LVIKGGLLKYLCIMLKLCYLSSLLNCFVCVYMYGVGFWERKELYIYGVGWGYYTIGK